MKGDDLRQKLRSIRVPEEEEARRRSWEVVREAAAKIESGGSGGRWPPRRGLAILAAVAAAAGLALSPAGAKVIKIIDPDGEGRPADTLDRIPGGGRLLVTTREGPWIVQPDGAKRRLGDYAQATFSPQGLFVAVTNQRQLLAVDPAGEPRWAIAARGKVRDPRWSPSGFRVAYRADRELRVVAGDGTGDRSVAKPVGGPAAWRPIDDRPTQPPREVLAYSSNRGRLIAVDVDTGKRLWVNSDEGNPRQVDWLSTQSLAVSRGGDIEILDGSGDRIAALTGSPESFVSGLDASPDGRRIAFIRGEGRRSELWLGRVSKDGRTRQRRVLSAPGFNQFTSVTFSPDGRRLLLAWEGLDQWLFIRPDLEQKQLGNLLSFGDLAEQFAPGAGPGEPAFPRVEDWVDELGNDE
ncbi:MAG: PQQ-binding-like beta-propeller repeat protein [Solirubrobacterales bacterium]